MYRFAADGLLVRLARRPDLLSAVALSAALAAVAFVAGDGSSDLSANTWVQVGLLVLGAAALIWWLLVRSAVPGPGRGALVWFAALALLTYVSIAWSVAPDTSWLEANRTLSYLAAFGAMLLLARLAPERWRALVTAVAASATAVIGYALVVKVFPDALDPRDPLGRLNAPLGYWNAVGDMAAMGIPAALWVGASPLTPRALRILAPAALAVLIAGLLMSVSRGALIAAVIGLAVWFALVPLRLRAAAVLAVGGAAGAAICGWALPSHGLSDDNLAEHTRVVAGHHFGIVLLVVLCLTLAASWALAIGMQRYRPALDVRRRVGTVLVVLVALIPVGGVIALAASSRGLPGEISHVWHTLTSQSGGAGNAPNRLLTLSNSRTRYWSLGLTVGEHHLLAGSGALGFAVAHKRYATVSAPVSHAHDFWIETFADLGLIGVAVALGLFVAWASAVRLALGGRRRSSGWSEERAALVTLLAVVVIFGLHSLVDWNWFIPGDAVLALACAGWLAGRGTLGEPASRLARPRRLVQSPGTAMASLAVVAGLLAAAWGVAQPLRAANADSAALTALQRGDAQTALAQARSAVAYDPLALTPLYDLSAIYQARGDAGAAREELLDSVALQPENPSSWQTLGSFDLGRHDVAPAVAEIERALELDPHSREIRALLAQARAA